MDRTRFTGVGRRRTAEYNAWLDMRDRCRNPRNRQFADYGGRGIAVDPRWATFEVFLADMGARPSPTHSLDRIDNNAGYGPENCRWATRAQQQANRRVVSSAGVIGVRFDEQRKSFKWDVQRNGRVRSGRTPTLSAAVDARNAALQSIEDNA